MGGIPIEIESQINLLITYSLAIYIAKGPFIKDVIDQGGGGIYQKMILLTSSLGYEGEGGSKMTKNQ